MIVHASILSTRPKEIAEFLAKLIDGEAIPFFPIPGSWVAVPRDGSGNTIEVYPLGTVARPGQGNEVQIAHEPNQSMFTGHHLLLSTKKSKEEVLRLGREMDFRTIACERGGIFELIEVWIENRFLIEVVTEPELKRYQAFWQLDSVKAKFGARK